MGDDRLVLDRLYAMTEAARVEMAWMAEVAEASGVPCFSRVWAAPSYHPAARKLQALEGRPVPNSNQFLRPHPRALQDFALVPSEVLGNGQSRLHYHCEGRELRTVIGIYSAGRIGFFERRAALAEVPPILQSRPEAPKPGQRELRLIYGQDGRLLHRGGTLEEFKKWRRTVDRLGAVFAWGSPAVLGGVAVSVHTVQQPEGLVRVVSLSAAKSVHLLVEPPSSLSDTGGFTPPPPDLIDVLWPLS